LTDHFGNATKISSLERKALRVRNYQTQKQRTYLGLEFFRFRGLNNKTRKLKNLAGRSRQTGCRSRCQLRRCSTCIIVYLHRGLAAEIIRKTIIKGIIQRHTGPELRERRPKGILFSEASIITSTLCLLSVWPLVAAAGEERP